MTQLGMSLQGRSRDWKAGNRTLRHTDDASNKSSSAKPSMKLRGSTSPSRRNTSWPSLPAFSDTGICDRAPESRRTLTSRQQILVRASHRSATSTTGAARNPISSTATGSATSAYEKGKQTLLDLKISGSEKHKFAAGIKEKYRNVAICGCPARVYVSTPALRQFVARRSASISRTSSSKKKAKLGYVSLSSKTARFEPQCRSTVLKLDAQTASN